MKRKLLGIVFAVTMALTMSMTAFADEADDIVFDDIVFDDSFFDSFVENEPVNDLPIPGEEDIDELVSAENLDSVVPIVGEDVVGTWVGSYDGTYSGENVKRDLKVEMTRYDDATKKIYGVAFISDGDDGMYFLEGSVDKAKRQLSFKGKTWIYNPNNFSFTSYKGTINENHVYEGNCDSSSKRNVTLTRTSAEPHKYATDPSSLKNGWAGEYDGLHSGTTVRRNYRFFFSEMSDTGVIKGVAIISPSEKAEAAYGANGSYRFKGQIDYATGEIKIQGYQWIDKPKDNLNWTFIKLYGLLDNEAGTIRGKSDEGIWAMKHDVTTPFVDVPYGEYYYYPVGWAVGKNVTTGTSDTTFSPNDRCTRAQVVTFLWRALGCPEPKSMQARFSDVTNPSLYYYKAVNWAAENGITTGKTPTRFAPNDTVTRGEFVTFLYRAEGKPNVAGGCPFQDVAGNKFYYAPVVWAAQNGVTTGKSPVRFDPKGACKRCEVVTFIYRAYNEN